MIDFGARDTHESEQFDALVQRVEGTVLADKVESAEKEKARNAEATADDSDGQTSQDHKDA